MGIVIRLTPQRRRRRGRRRHHTHSNKIKKQRKKKKTTNSKVSETLCSYIEMRSAMETPSSSLPNTIVSSAEPPWRRQFDVAYQKWCKNGKFSASKRKVAWHSLQIAN
jgi:hypothetical protein